MELVPLLLGTSFMIVIALLASRAKTEEQLAVDESARQLLLSHLATRFGARRTGEHATAMTVMGRRVRASTEIGATQKRPWEEWTIVVEGELGQTAPFVLDPLGALPVRITSEHVDAHTADDGLARALHDGAVRASLDDAILHLELLSVRAKTDGPLVAIARAERVTPVALEHGIDALVRLANALTSTRPRLAVATRVREGAAESPSGSSVPGPRFDR